jgi:hypothetical protein
MAGFFGEFDVAGAADDPFNVPIGTYKGTITAFDGDIGGNKKDGSGEYRGMQFDITIREGKEEGGIYSAYFPLPLDTDSQRAAGFKRSAIKKFLAGCEVPEEQMNDIDPNELINLDVVFKIVERKAKGSSRTFKNLDWVRLDHGEVLSGDGEGLEVFAPEVTDDEFGL